MNIFLKYAGPFEALAREFASLFRLPVEPRSTDQGNLCHFTCLDVDFYVFDNHGLVNDCGIPFEEYTVEIDLRKLAAGESTPGYVGLLEALAHYLAARLSASLSCEARVVTNLQTTVQIYGREG